MYLKSRENPRNSIHKDNTMKAGHSNLSQLFKIALTWSGKFETHSNLENIATRRHTAKNIWHLP